MICEVNDSVYRQYSENVRLKRLAAKNQVKTASRDVEKHGRTSKYFTMYQNIGSEAKNLYSLDCPNIQITHSLQFDKLKAMAPVKVKDYVLKTAQINYKKDQKWEDLRDLVVMTYTLLQDKTSTNPVCVYSPRSYKLYEEFSGKKIGQRTFFRLIDIADKVGFICANRFLDDNGNLRKNYRHDAVCPENSYSTSYLVNVDAIINNFSDFIKEKSKDYLGSRKFFAEVTSLKRQNQELIDDDFESVISDESLKKLFNGLYDIKTQTFLKVPTKYKYIEKATSKEDIQFNCDHFFKVIDLESDKAKKLKIACFHLFKYLKSENCSKIEDIITSKKYQKLIGILAEAKDDKTSIDTVEIKMIREIFNYKSHGAYNILNGLLREYNSDKDQMTKKTMNINMLKKRSLSTRVWSEYCVTSKKDGSREQFKKDYKVTYDQDVTAMVPNMLRFLKEGDEFKIEDSYTLICDELKSYGMTMTRDEVKDVFLRMEFSKSEKAFLKSVRDMLALKYMNDPTNLKYYPYIRHFSTKNHLRQYLKKDWLTTQEGQSQMALYAKLYSVIEEKYGSKQDSFMFFWESLLETIVTVSLKRKGITCYNVYDDFMADKKFNLEDEMKAAAAITYQAYNGNIKPLKEFYENGRK